MRSVGRTSFGCWEWRGTRGGDGGDGIEGYSSDISVWGFKKGRRIDNPGFARRSFCIIWMVLLKDHLFFSFPFKSRRDGDVCHCERIGERRN